MAHVKVAVIGAGSFVFGPSVLHDATLEHRLDGIELALVDVDGEVVELMAGVGRRMARDAGVKAAVTAHTDRAAALDGADFVICSAARQVIRRFQADCEIVDRLAPGHLVTEFGGVAGISYSLRQIALILEITADMRKRCPKAWLLDAANPLPRVTQAAHEDGVRTAGFCSASIGAYGMLWSIFHGEPSSYPFTKGRDAFDATMAGLNHFSWLIELRDRRTGADLMPELRKRVAAGESCGQTRCEQLCRETGYLPVAGDSHIRDFLPPTPQTVTRREATHGSPDERRRRLKLMADIGAGTAPWDELLVHRSWEKPVDLIAALAFGKRAEFTSLNLINGGQIPSLPRNVFVETAATASADGVAPQTVVLPAELEPYCQRTAEVTDTIVRAAMKRKRTLLDAAVELDPTILDKAAGRAALAECIKAHADVLPRYE
jgi:alpha-galactosidase